MKQEKIEYSKTKKGILTIIYQRQKERNKKYGYNLGYSLKELHNMFLEDKKFNSIKEAVAKTGLNQSLISSVLAGVRNHTGGYKFIYENPNLLN